MIRHISAVVGGFGAQSPARHRRTGDGYADSQEPAPKINDDEGRRLLRIIRRGTGPVVTWRRAQMVLLSAQGSGRGLCQTHLLDIFRSSDARGIPREERGATTVADRVVAKIASQVPREALSRFTESADHVPAGRRTPRVTTAVRRAPERNAAGPTTAALT